MACPSLAGSSQSRCRRDTITLFSMVMLQGAPLQPQTFPQNSFRTDSPTGMYPLQHLDPPMPCLVHDRPLRRLRNRGAVVAWPYGSRLHVHVHGDSTGEQHRTSASRRDWQIVEESSVCRDAVGLSRKLLQLDSTAIFASGKFTRQKIRHRDSWTLRRHRTPEGESRSHHPYRRSNR